MNRYKILIYNKLLQIVPRSCRSTIIRRMGVKIGTNCEIYRDVSFGSEPERIHIGNNVRITNGVKFCTHDGGMWVLRNLNMCGKHADIFGDIVIGNNVHIGWNTIIMPGVIVGDNTIIGCGAIVTKDIPNNSVVGGVPAKIICSIDDYKRKNRLNFTE